MIDFNQKYFLLGGFDPAHTVHFSLAAKAAKHFELSASNPLTLAIGFPSKGYLIERGLAARFAEACLPQPLHNIVIARVLTAKDIVYAEGRTFIHGFRHKLTGELDPHNTVEFEAKLQGLMREAKAVGQALVSPQVNYFFPTPLSENPYFTSTDEIISTKIREDLFSREPNFAKLRAAVPKLVADALITVRRAVDISDEAALTWYKNKMSGPERPTSVIEFNRALARLVGYTSQL